ncbi:MAG: hypothetical protein NTV43_02560 [Methylococcales bacterium]|nr:hypothetical protein [Methylococcales bacterium]
MSIFSKTDDEILNGITPIMDNMMEGSTEIDHAKHTRDFTVGMKSIVTPEQLQIICKNYQSKWGLFGKRDFVAIFRRSDSVAVIWRQYCTNSTDEFVAEAVFVEQEGRLLIDHAMIY